MITKKASSYKKKKTVMKVEHVRINKTQSDIKRMQRDFSNLRTALEPYAGYIDEWIESDECFLTNKEIIVLNAMIKNGFYLKDAAFEVQLRPSEVERVLIEILTKLIFRYDEYKLYVDKRETEPLNEVPTNSKKYKFLYGSLDLIELPTAVKNILKRTGCKTLAMVLSYYSQEEIRGLRRFGPKAYTSLCDLLQKNKCLYLFEKTQVQRRIIES